MASEQEQFEAMMVALSSTNNAYRNQAEQAFKHVKDTNGMWLFQALVELAGTSTKPEAVQLCLIELRKLIAHKDFTFASFTPDAVNYVKNRELSIIGATGDAIARGLAANLVASTAKKLYKENLLWPELWTLLIQTMANNGAAAGARSGCCSVFEEVSTDETLKALAPQHRMLSGAFCACLAAPDTGLALTAVKSLAGFLKTLALEDEARYEPCISHVLNLLAKGLNEGNFEAAKDVAMYICDLVDSSPTVFRKHTTSLLQGMMQVASTPAVAIQTRHMAVEVMLTYCESEPKTIRKVPGFAAALFNLLFGYLQTPDYPADWATTRDMTDEDEVECNTDFDIGATGIDRLATSLRAKHVQQIASQAILSNIHSQDWRLRNAAVTALTYIIEACSEEYEPQLKAILDYILPLLRDENQYIRHAVTLCLAQCCTDFAPTYQKDHHAIILPALVHCLNDVPRIQALACAALNTFFDEAPSGEESKEDEQRAAEFAQLYAQPLLAALIPLMNNSPHMFVKKEACEAIGSIAEFFGTSMTPYVDLLVPEFQKLLAINESQFADPKEAIEVKCITLQSLTLMAAGVKMAGFSRYAHDVCQMLLQQLAVNYASTDTRSPFIMRAWTCMAECMEGEIRPYLPTVIPRILKDAASNCDYEYIDDSPGQTIPEAPTGCVHARFTLPDKGEVIVRLKTAEVEEKSLAIAIMRILLEVLSKTDVIAPYLDEIARVAVECLTFKMLEEVRRSACHLVVEVILAYKRLQPQALNAIATHLEPQLIQLILDEPSVEVVIELWNTVNQLLIACDQPLLSKEQVAHSAEVLLHVVQASLQRRTSVQEDRSKAEEDDDETKEALEDEENTEDDLLEVCCQATGAYLKKLGDFFPFFAQHFLPTVQMLLTPTMAPTEQTAGLHFLCRLVESRRPEASAYLKDCGVAFSNYVNSDDADHCQAAFYGLGETLLAARGYESLFDYRGFADSVYRSVVGFFQSKKKASSKDFDFARPNVVSAALKLMECSPASCDVNALWTAVLQYLPSTGDEEESQVVHERLVRWLRENNQLVADPNLRGTLLQKLKAAGEKYLNEATQKQLALM